MSFLWFPCSFARDGVWSMEYGVISLCRNQLPAVSHVPEDWILRNEVRAECFGPLFRALLILCCIHIIDITDITDIVLSLKSVDASRSSYRQDAVVNLVGCFAESQLEQASNDVWSVWWFLLIPGIWNKIWLNRGDLHDIPSVSMESESEVPGAPEVLWGIQCCQLCCYVPYTSPVLFCVEQMCILNVIHLIDRSHPLTTEIYRDHEAKDVFWLDRYWHAQNDHVRPLTALTSLRDVGPM